MPRRRSNKRKPTSSNRSIYTRKYRRVPTSWGRSPHFSASKIQYQMRGFLRRKAKAFNYNASLIKSRTGPKLIKVTDKHVINGRFTATDLDSSYDPVTYYATDYLFALNNILNTKTSMKFNDFDGDQGKYCRQITGLHLKLTINATSNHSIYVKVAIVRDKYMIYPGFVPPTYTGNPLTPYGGITFSLFAPSSTIDDTNQTAFFQNMEDPNKVQNFNECKQNLRTIQRINPLRYRVIWTKVYKLAYSNSGNLTNVVLINKYIPYKKNLIYKNDSDSPTNDNLRLFIYSSSYPPGYNQNEGMFNIQGSLNVRGLSQYYQSSS